MRHATRILVLVGALVLPTRIAAKSQPEPTACPPDVAALVAAACPCTGPWKNHGQYVRCVVHARRALRRAGCSRDALRGLVPGAARSRCGRRGAVTTTSTTSTTTSTSSTTSTTTTTLAVGLVYGNSVEFPAASANFADYLLGISLTIPVPSVLTHLCVIAKAGGANVILALYSDNAGFPDRLVAATSATPMTVGPMEIPVTPIALAAGTYWLMGVYDTDASIGFDQSDPTSLVEYAAHTFANPMPDPFGGATPYTGQKFNYYVRVE
jgi:hypothetical protein